MEWNTAVKNWLRKTHEFGNLEYMPTFEDGA